MKNKKKFSLKEYFAKEQTTVQLASLIVLFFIIMMLFRPNVVLKKSFLVNMVYLFPEYGILAIAMMMPIIAGGIDLSNIATANLAGIVSCLFLKLVITENTPAVVAGLFLIIAFAIAMIIGLVCGMLPGYLIGGLGIPPMLATLGSADLIMGLSLGFTKGSAITEIPPILNSVFNYYLFGFIPVTLIVFVIVALAANWILKCSVFGYKLYMLGSNPTASKYSGVDNKRIIMTTHMISGMFATVSGILMCAHFNSAKANLGASYQTPSILICLLGGVSSMGGFGKVKNVVLSVLLLQVLSSIINMIPTISTFYRDLLWGGVLILVLAANHIGDILKVRKDKKARMISAEAVQNR